jgi:hypothetical protein
MNFAKLTIIILFCCCTSATDVNPYPAVGAIPVPGGYQRTTYDNDPFAVWLRELPIKKDRTVHLFNGDLKRNQHPRFAPESI